MVESIDGGDPTIIKSGDGLAEIPPDVEDVAVGDSLRFRPFDVSRFAPNSVQI